jgi:hypothetical protein
MLKDRDLRPEELERVLRATCRLLCEELGTIDEMTDMLAPRAFAAAENWLEKDELISEERAQEEGDLVHLLDLVLHAAGRR